MEAEQDKTVSAELKGLPEAESQSCSSTSEPKEKESFQVPLVLTLSAANFLNTLTVQSSVIILPSIGRDIGIPAARQQWIISSYYMTYGCFLLLWGRIADLYGRRNVFIAGSIWVAASTIAVPFAKNEIAFDVLRGCTGLGAAANVSAGLGILGNAFEAGRAKNYAFSAFGGAHSLGTIMGILFGGVIAQYLSWEWVFWIFGIIASIVVVAGFFVIQPDGKAHASQEKAGVDVLGGALITASLLLFTYSLTEGEIGGWARPWIPVLLAVSVLLAVVFVLWQRHLELRTQRAPLLKMSIFNNKRFSAAQVILCLFYGAFNNFLLFATYYYQDYQRFSIIHTTLYFLPTGIVGLLGSLAAARLLSRVRSDLLLLFSTTCVAVACLIFALPIPTTTSYWATGFIAMCLAALGSDLLAPTLTLFTALSLPSEDQALGGGVCNAVVQVGRVVALAVATAVQTAVEARSGGAADGAKGVDALLQGLRAAQYVDFGIACAAGVVVVYAFRGGHRIGMAGRAGGAADG